MNKEVFSAESYVGEMNKLSFKIKFVINDEYKFIKIPLKKIDDPIPYIQEYIRSNFNKAVKKKDWYLYFLFNNKKIIISKSYEFILYICHRHHFHFPIWIGVHHTQEIMVTDVANKYDFIINDDLRTPSFDDFAVDSMEILMFDFGKIAIKIRNQDDFLESRVIQENVKFQLRYHIVNIVYDLVIAIGNDKMTNMKLTNIKDAIEIDYMLAKDISRHLRHTYIANDIVQEFDPKGDHLLGIHAPGDKIFFDHLEYAKQNIRNVIIVDKLERIPKPIRESARIFKLPDVLKKPVWIVVCRDSEPPNVNELVQEELRKDNPLVDV